MIELGLEGPQAGFDIAQTFAVGELSESEAKKLVQAGKADHFIIAAISSHALAELSGNRSINCENTVRPVNMAFAF